MVEIERNEISRPPEHDAVPNLMWPVIRKAQFLYTSDIDGVNTDSLMVLFADNRPATSVDAGVEGEVLIRYDPETCEVIGVEIEGFEGLFMGKHHPELADGWAALKPEEDNGLHNSQWLTDEAALDYARRLKDIAYQGTLAPNWPSVDRGDVMLWSRSDVPA